MSRSAAQVNARVKSRQGKIHTDNPDLFKLFDEDNAFADDTSRVGSRQTGHISATPSVTGVLKKTPRTARDSRASSKAESVASPRKAPKQVAFDTDSYHKESTPGKGCVTHASMSDEEKNVNPVADENKKDEKRIEEPAEGTHQPGASVNWDSEDFSNVEPVNTEQPKEGEESENKSPSAPPDIADSGRTTVGSSCSELRQINSPSRKSLNLGDGKTPLPSSPVRLEEEKGEPPVRSGGEGGEAVIEPDTWRAVNKGVTEPVDDNNISKTDPTGQSNFDNNECINDKQSVTPTNTRNIDTDPETGIDSENRTPTNETLNDYKVQDSSAVLDSNSGDYKETESARDIPQDTTTDNAGEEDNTVSVNNKDDDKDHTSHPAPTLSEQSPRESESRLAKPTPTPRSTAPSGLNFTRVEQEPPPRLVGPYSSQRLKGRGGSARRSVAGSQDFQEFGGEIKPSDSLEEKAITKDLPKPVDSLEEQSDNKSRISKGQAVKNKTSVGGPVTDTNASPDDPGFSGDSLDIEKDSLDIDNSVGEDQQKVQPVQDNNKQQESEIPEPEKLRNNNSPDLSLEEHERYLPGPEAKDDDVSERHVRSPGEVTEVASDPRVEFVIKPDPNKPGVSRYSSAQGSGRFSSGGDFPSSRRTSFGVADSRVNRGGVSATRNPSSGVGASVRDTPSGKRVLYVESPTFTREEEEEYRYVSSRLDNLEEEEDGGLHTSQNVSGYGYYNRQEDGADTYRQLDMAAVQQQQSYQQQTRPQQGLPPSHPAPAVEKRVRYSDVEDGRYGRARRADERRGLSAEAERYTDFAVNEFALDTHGKRPGIPEVERNRQAPPHQPPQPLPRSGIPSAGNQDINERRGGAPSPNYQQGYPTNQPGQAPYSQHHPYGSHHDQPLRDVPPHRQQYAQQQGWQNGQSQHQHHQQNFNNDFQHLHDHQQQPPPPHQQDGSYTQYSSQPQPQQTRQPPNMYQHPQHPPQQQNYYQQPQQQQQQTAPPAAKSLPLPTGPSYDPVDEEDLQRETTYQQVLKNRIEETRRQTEETHIPRLPLAQGQGYPPQGQGQRYVPASQDFARDSLDFYYSTGGEGETLRKLEEAFGGGPTGGTHQNPPQRQHPRNHFRNDAADSDRYAGPQSNFGYNDQAYGQREPLQPRSRLDNVNLESDDFGEDYDDAVRRQQPRRNPHVQQRFFDPELAAAVAVPPPNNYSNNSATRVLPPQQKYQQHQYQHQQDTDRSDFDDSNSYRGERFQDENVYDDDGGSRRGAPLQDGRGGGNQRVNPAPAGENDYMEASHPRPPKYDYVNANKEDYGKPPPKSYKQILEIQREEKEKLNEVFIHPKPKGQSGGILKKKRGGKGNHQGQGDTSSRQGSQYSGEGSYVEDGATPGLDDTEGMSAAEQVWARRSNQLAGNKSGATGRGRRQSRGGANAVQPGRLYKYNSDSSIHQTSSNRQYGGRPPQQPQAQQRPSGADKRAFMTDLPTPVNEQIANQATISVPISPRHGEIQLQPIHQQIVTEDGQRISVDVNLRLISPPPYAGGGSGHNNNSGDATAGYAHQPYRSGARQYPAELIDDYTSADPGADYRYVSPRGRYSADEVLRALTESRTELNPYGKVPPIDSIGTQDYRLNDHPSSAPILDQGGSYMDMYMRQREKPVEKPWYKVYGLKDYKKMQKEVKLGTLGPDLDSEATRERREKAQRQHEYAKAVMERNKTGMINKKPPSFPRPREENDIMNRRRLAQEYAKSVPKPTVRIRPNEYNNYELASEKSPIAKHHRKGGLGGASTTPGGGGDGGGMSVTPGGEGLSPTGKSGAGQERDMEVLDLERLRQRYEQDKQNEAAIRQTSGRTY